MVVWSEFEIGLYMYSSWDIRLCISSSRVFIFSPIFTRLGSWTYRYLEHLLFNEH